MKNRWPNTTQKQNSFEIERDRLRHTFFQYVLGACFFSIQVEINSNLEDKSESKTSFRFEKQCKLGEIDASELVLPK